MTALAGPVMLRGPGRPARADGRVARRVRKALRLAVRTAAVLSSAAAAACCTCGPCPPSASLIATRPPGPEGNVTVTFGGAAASDRPLLLYSGHRLGACVAFEPHVGTSSSSVQLSMIGWDPSCPTEIDVFAPYFGAWAKLIATDRPDNLAWFQNALAMGSVDIPLPALTRVRVAAWVVADAADRTTAANLRDAQFDEALPILEGMGAGVTLDRVDGTLAPGEVSPDCAQAGSIVTGGHYDPTAINVYYVKYYLDQEWGAYAIDCWIPAHPDIIFVSWGNPYTPFPSLAHELGHALGLIIPKGPANTIGGHTNTVYGEFGTNLMVSGASAVTFITVGQSYGMNFDSFTWMNRAGAPAQPVARTCQDSFGAGVCPAVTMQVPGWPVP